MAVYSRNCTHLSFTLSWCAVQAKSSQAFDLAASLMKEICFS